MKSSFCTLILSCLFLGGYAQYYYKDLVAARQMMEKQRLYRDNKVKSVVYRSFDGDGNSIEGFTGGQTVSPDFSSIHTDITDPLSGVSLSTARFDAAGRLMETVDSSDGYHNSTSYTYDEQGRIRSIRSVSVSAGGFELNEEHQWTYNSQNVPISMLKVKNNNDSSFISFVLDEAGDPGEEKLIYKGQAQPSYYYYFDKEHRLTDIVRYNARARRLLPDYIFEYEEGKLATMLAVSEGNTDYQKWYYSYNENGLKGQDACYSKTQVLIARVEYEYNTY